MSSEKASKILSDTTVNLKYAKWIPQEERRETWAEICLRNMNMHLKTFGYLENDELLHEIMEVYENYVIPKKV